MPSKPKVLVVGTTTDYVDWIQRACPHEALFLTDPLIRYKAEEPVPASSDELHCDLSDYDHALHSLERHLIEYHLYLDGVACFDCESMELAAVLAKHFSLPYPSVSAVRNCRDKLRAKILWQKHTLNTPPAIPVHSADEAVHYFKTLGAPLVLKPLSGSGSELVFACTSVDACEYSYQQIQEGLHNRRAQRMYANDAPDAHLIMAEGLVEGQEYSCDFVIENKKIQVIRLTQKIIDRDGPFGTTRGYLLPAKLPPEIDEETLHQTLLHSAAALKIERAICMLDFMVSEGRMILLELAPRPGGDCLPYLLRRGYHLDILKLQLDFSRQKTLQFLQNPNCRTLLGLRLHACQSGILKSIDTHNLKEDSRVQEVYLIRRPGHKINLPPEDYDSWLLGHIIFEPDGKSEITAQCNAVLDKIKVTVA